MTNGLNRVTLFGNLGAEPELRTTAEGNKVLSFRLATNEVYFDREHNKQERTEWHRVVVFGNRAEPLSRFLAKGSRVLVEGRLQTSSYEKDGLKRHRTEVIAHDVCLAHSRNTTSSSMSSSPVSQRSGFVAAELEDNVPF